MDRYPGTRITNFYQDIRTYGRGHEEYYERASEQRRAVRALQPERPPRVVQGPARANGRWW